jgi:CDP-diacylglycerol--glycerol-3-phosphate 3-phosphatidyltransferase
VEKVQAEEARLERKKKGSPYETFTDWARESAQVITYPVGRVLGKLGVHPNTMTLLGSLLTVAVAVVLASGRLTLGGWLLVFIAPIDALDGALARVVGRKSRFGALLDSTLDRVSEAALLAGLAAHYLQQGDSTGVMLSIVAVAGGALVSYTRARAEALGFTCKVGVLTRLERMAVLVIGLIVGWPTVALWVLAVGTALTAIHRVVYVYLQSRRSPSGE